MNLHRLLLARAADPVRIGLIGCGKFASMFLHQVPRTPGLHVAGIADLAPDRARAALRRVHWPEAAFAAASLEEALAQGSSWITEDAAALIADPRIEVLVEATGDPAAGLLHARAAIAAGKHVVMVNVEADVLAGPLLAREAAAQGVVYSMAYGDQPALVCEMVDTLRAAGFAIVAAGKGTKYLPEYHASTPATVWTHYGLSEEQARAGGMNPRMFNSFLDGTKSAIEMAAIANAAWPRRAGGRAAVPARRHLRSCRRCCARAHRAAMLETGRHGGGGVLARAATARRSRTICAGASMRCSRARRSMPAAASPNTASPPIRRAASPRCGGPITSSAWNSGCRWRRWRCGGSRPAWPRRGTPMRWPWPSARLRAGEVLDGEGGETVWGKCIPAARSRALAALPIGLAHGVRLLRDVPAGAMLTRADVRLDPALPAVAIRAEMEAACA